MSSPPNDLGDTSYRTIWNEAHWIDMHTMDSIVQTKHCRVYVDGVYDLFHFGHAEMLGRVRAHFGPTAVIIAGIARDDDCMKYKRLPILNQHERARSLRACKYVDEVIEGAPWVITQEFLDTHAIDYVCHDEGSYPSADGTTADIYAYVKSVGKFVAIPRTPSISTSEILERILSKLHSDT